MDSSVVGLAVVRALVGDLSVREDSSEGDTEGDEFGQPAGNEL